MFTNLELGKKLLTEYFNTPYLGELIRNKQQKFFDRFNLHNKNSIKLKTNNVQFYYKNNIFAVELDMTITNPHQDLANLRAYFEWELIKQYGGFKTYFTKVIIDVGASTRLYNSLVCQVALRPILDSSDVDRAERIDENYINFLSNFTLQEFLQTTYYDENYKNMLFNFTDVLYYIDDNTLIKIAKKAKNNQVFAIATMHIVDPQEGTFPINQPEMVGITQVKHQMLMSVLGNNTSYFHAIRFPTLYYDNHVVISIDHEYSILIAKLRQVDLGATRYCQLVLMKTKNVNMSVTVQGADFKVDLSHSVLIPYKDRNIIINDRIIDLYNKIIADSVTSLEELGQLKEEDPKFMNIIRFAMDKDPDTMENITQKILYIIHNQLSDTVLNKIKDKNV